MMNKLDKAKQFQDRTKQFAIDVIQLMRRISKNQIEARIIIRQVIRSATSVGANYRAACRGRSKKEFVAKLGIVIEEADESLFWLEIIRDTELLDGELIKPLLKEAGEIVAITVKSKQTAVKSLNR